MMRSTGHEPDAERLLTPALSHPPRRRDSAASPMGEGEWSPIFRQSDADPRFMVPMRSEKTSRVSMNLETKASSPRSSPPEEGREKAPALGRFWGSKRESSFRV